MKITFLNGRVVTIPSELLVEFAECLEQLEKSYRAGELYLIDVGAVPLAPGWECSTWGPPL